jgi:hypothetical protein
VGRLRSRLGPAIIVIAVAMTIDLVPAMAADQAAPHVRYTDTGLDPDDVPVDESSCCQQDPDIRATTRKVWIDDQDRKWLTVSFRAYEALDDYWAVRVRLDSRAGPRADAKMWIFDPGLGEPPGCTFRRKGSTLKDGTYRASEDSARCRVPLRWAEPRKRIRWKLFSAGGGEGTGPVVDEYAPDSGWYS